MSTLASQQARPTIVWLTSIGGESSACSYSSRQLTINKDYDALSRQSVDVFMAREQPHQLYTQSFILKHINTMLIHSHGLQREEPWRIINRDSRTELFIPDSSKNGQLRCAAIPGRVVLSTWANNVKTNVGA